MQRLCDLYQRFGIQSALENTGKCQNYWRAARRSQETFRICAPFKCICKTGSVHVEQPALPNGLLRDKLQETKGGILGVFIFTEKMVMKIIHERSKSFFLEFGTRKSMTGSCTGHFCGPDLKEINKHFPGQVCFARGLFLRYFGHCKLDFCRIYIGRWFLMTWGQLRGDFLSSNSSRRQRTSSR